MKEFFCKLAGWHVFSDIKGYSLKNNLFDGAKQW